MNIQDSIIFFMEILGTIAFAASGAMVGIRKRMDIFGICVLGVVTAVGGGMTRDVILGKLPSALEKPVYVGVSVATALAIFILLYIKQDLLSGRLGTFYDKAMLGMDSVGLGIFTSLGVMSGIDNGYPDNTFLLVFIGMLTGVGGGLMRDMMAAVSADFPRYLSLPLWSWRSGFWRHTFGGICRIRKPCLNCCSF